MELGEAIEKRRSYRALEPVGISGDSVRELASAAGLAPSCYNNQPWRFVFVYEKEKLEQMHETLSKGNEWAKRGSMIIAVLGKKDDDCVIGERAYCHFDIGMSVGLMMLKATEFGLVMHPIAGYSPVKVREVLAIPEEYDVITLLIVGKKGENLEGLSGKQAEDERKRPERIPLGKFCFMNGFTP